MCGSMVTICVAMVTIHVSMVTTRVAMVTTPGVVAATRVDLAADFVAELANSAESCAAAGHPLPGKVNVLLSSGTVGSSVSTACGRS